MTKAKTRHDQDVVQRLAEYPYHVPIDITKGNLYMLDWLLEKGPPPSEWCVMGLREEGPDINGKWCSHTFDWYCFKGKRDALLFKILWEHRARYWREVEWSPERGAHLL